MAMITVDQLGLEKKSGQRFRVRQVYFAKSCQQIWVRVNQPFYTMDRKQYFTIQIALIQYS